MRGRAVSWPLAVGPCRFHAAAVIAVALLLPGCFSVPGLVAAGLVSGLGGGGVEGGRMQGGTRAQNGKGFDRSIGQALAEAGKQPTAACRALLPKEDGANSASQACSYRLVCLPGAPRPAEMMMCEKREPQPD